MTDAEVLKKAVEKAVKAGWKCGEDLLLGDELKYIIFPFFSHAFAKAFWGTYKTCNQDFPNKCSHNTRDMDGYDDAIYFNHEVISIDKAHLKKMVLYKNPINYLREFIK